MLLPQSHCCASAPGHGRLPGLVPPRAYSGTPAKGKRCRQTSYAPSERRHGQCRAAADTPSSSSSSTSSRSSSSLPASLADSAASTSGRDAPSSSTDLLTFQEVQQIAAARGLHLSLKTLGPGYRIVCRDGACNSPQRSGVLCCNYASNALLKQCSVT
jgi:hypothetical protein